MAKPKKKEKGDPAQAIVPQVPQDLRQCIDMIAQTGTLQRQLDGIQNELNEKIKQLTERAREETAPREVALKSIALGIHEWAEKNRDKILPPKAKSVMLATGEIAWKFSKGRVESEDDEMAINALETAGLHDLVRKKKELDKQEILKNPDLVADIPSLKVVKDETFSIKPTEYQVTIESPKKKRIVIRSSDKNGEGTVSRK